MLWTHIQNLRMRDSHRLGVLPCSFDNGQIHSLGALCSLARRKVLSQSMSDKLRMRQDSPQIRVAVKSDAEHVPRFTFGPICTFPDTDGGIYRRILCRDWSLQP